MKKSNTTMKVPARTIGSGAHRLAPARPSHRSGAGRGWVNVCVLMLDTVPAPATRVDYPPGNAEPEPGAIG